MTMLDLMQGVVVHHLRFEVRSREMGALGAQPGSALRGALYGALARQYCPDRQAVHLPGHKSACPVCRLLATEDPSGERGQDVPRPVTVEPPPGDRPLRAGESWCFGLSLIGTEAAATFPFIIRAAEAMGESGVGPGRARFDIVGVDTYNPLDGACESLLEGRVVRRPALPVTAPQVAARAAELPSDRVTLEFLTPLRIGEDKRLAHRPDLGILLRRLIERCQAIATHFGGSPLARDRARWREVTLRLSALAAEAQLTRDETRWLDVVSGSRRTGRTSPIGGLVGLAQWEGNLAEAMSWLLWGQSLHVGKSTVKGNGWYRVVEG